MKHVPECSKTRFAPTPSGYLHVGNVLSFAITAALAQRTGATIFLRIDDVDRERTEERYVEDIFETFAYLGIEHHEGPRSVPEFEARYSQGHRQTLYNEALQQLVATGAVYACRCSRSEVAAHSADGGYPGTCRLKHIPLAAAGVSWRIDTSMAGSIPIKQYGHSALTMDLPDEMRDFVVRKKDGLPAYQLTSVVDDVHFGIDLVVRGQDLLPSSLAQLYLAQVAGLHRFADTVFHHHALVTDNDGAKLSKSAGATSVQSMRKNGMSRGQILQLVAQHLRSVGTDVTDWNALINGIAEALR